MPTEPQPDRLRNGKQDTAATHHASLARVPGLLVEARLESLQLCRRSSLEVHPSCQGQPNFMQLRPRNRSNRNRPNREAESNDEDTTSPTMQTAVQFRKIITFEFTGARENGHCLPRHEPERLQPSRGCRLVAAQNKIGRHLSAEGVAMTPALTTVRSECKDHTTAGKPQVTRASQGRQVSNFQAYRGL